MEPVMGKRPSMARTVSSAVLFGLLFLGAALGATAESHLPGNAEATSLIVPSKPVPALFVFGDSIVDTGENDYLTNPLVPKSNFYPYGESFFLRIPTGRFSNGRLIPDFLSQDFLLPYLQPYLAPNPNPFKFSQGTNFASAGSGILDTTNANEGVINLKGQVQQFQSVVAQLKSVLGSSLASQIISNAIYVFITGSNDVNEYVKNTTIQQEYSVNEYLGLMISTFESQVQIVLNSGARKIVVGGLGPLGCVPEAVASTVVTPSNGTPPGSCVEFLNEFAQGYNGLLQSYVSGVNTAANSTYFVLTTTYDYFLNLIRNGSSQGFTEGSTACCGGGPFNGIVDCGKGNYTLCPNVFPYVFWDFIHPTERVYEILTGLVYNGNTSYVEPINIQQLAALP